MATPSSEQDTPQPDVSQQEANPMTVGWLGKVEEQYRRTKQHVETYPYVWASYILVYGGFGLWFTYRWRKLRQTEERVRVLQGRLRQLFEARKSNGSASVTEQSSMDPVKIPPPSDKATK